MVHTLSSKGDVTKKLKNKSGIRSICRDINGYVGLLYEMNESGKNRKADMSEKGKMDIACLILT
jgi:hypothetical protein